MENESKNKVLCGTIILKTNSFGKKIETVTESNFLLTCKSKLLLFILKLLFRRYLSVKTVDLDNDQELFGDVLKTTTLLEQDLFYWFYNCVLEF